eukprot:s52_g50.t1
MVVNSACARNRPELPSKWSRQAISPGEVGQTRHIQAGQAIERMKFFTEQVLPSREKLVELHRKVSFRVQCSGVQKWSVLKCCEEVFNQIRDLQNKTFAEPRATNLAGAPISEAFQRFHSMLPPAALVSLHGAPLRLALNAFKAGTTRYHPPEVCLRQVAYLEQAAASAPGIHELIRIQSEGAVQETYRADMLRGLQRSIIQYSSAITACAAADLWPNSLRLFLERNLQPDTISCNAALNGCSRSRQWQEAVEMLMAMPSRHLRSNIITVNTLIFGLQGRFWPWAQKLLHDVEEDDLQTDLISYNTSMNLSDHWQRSLDLLEQMRWRLVRSDSSSYIANLNAADAEIKLSLETKPWAILLQLVARELHNELAMKNALISALTAWPCALHLLGLQADLVTFNASIASVAAWEKTLQLLRELKRCAMPGTAISYTSAMCQNWQSAWQLLEEARQISLQDNLIMHNAAMSAAEEGGHWQEALFAMCSCWTRDVISYNAIISACEKGHRWAGAMYFFDGIEFREIRPSTISFNSSLSACLFQHWLQWNLDEEEELQLTEHELGILRDPAYGHDLRQLSHEDTCPCFLHSYSTALRGCRCGCRTTAFHDSRLLRDGVRGFHVISYVAGRARWLQRREAAVLCGLDPTMRMPADLRAGLCLVEQCASPLQAVWSERV